MRNILMIAILAIAVSACKKDKLSDIHDSIQGKWELRSSAGGFVGPLDYAPGNGNIVKFTSSHFMYYKKDSLLSETPYTISVATNPQNGRRAGKIMDATGYSFFAEVTAGKLHLYHGTLAADGVVLIYTKLNQP